MNYKNSRTRNMHFRKFMRSGEYPLDRNAAKKLRKIKTKVSIDFEVRRIPKI